jgi:protein TonB
MPSSFAAPYAQAAYEPASGKFPAGLAWAIVLHMVVGYAVLSGKANEVMKVIQKPLQAVVIQEVILPPPPVPAPLPPKPKPAPQPVQEVPKPLSAAPISVPVTPTALQPSAIATPTPVVQAAPETVLAKPAQVVLPPAASPERASQAPSLESEYIGMLRATIDAAKRYPTGRQASQQRPQGAVKLWFVLNRAGALVDVGVLPGDAPPILEDSAKAAVRRSAFPPFPATAWPGDEQHKFSAELNFLPPSGS